MNVVILSDSWDINGGAAKVARTAATSLADRGHDVLFVSAINACDEVPSRPGLRLHCLSGLDAWRESNRMRAAARGIWNASLAAELRAVLRTCNPSSTVVHLHQWTRVLSPSAIAVLAELGLPTVVTLHDFFLFCPNGLYFDRSRGVCCDRRPLSMACIGAKCDSVGAAHKAVRIIRQMAGIRAWRRMPHSPSLIHVSEPAMEVAMEVGAPFLPPKARHYVVANPVDVRPGSPVDVRANDLYIFVGRFTAEKAPVAFAEAAAAAGVQAAFCGDGPEFARVQHANSAVMMLPWTDREGVHALLSRSRCLVFPSIWKEPLGLVALEAMARGIPVVCSRGTGAASWIVDGLNGFLVDPGDVTQLGRRLVDLRDDDVAARLGRAAYQHFWCMPPTPARHAEQLERCYLATLERAEPAAGLDGRAAA